MLPGWSWSGMVWLVKDADRLEESKRKWSDGKATLASLRTREDHHEGNEQRE